MTTRSADECEMSRSCQSATFSSPTTRRAAHDAREPADALGDDRVPLVRHRRRALLPAAERLLHLGDLGAREMPDLERELVERRRDDRERGRGARRGGRAGGSASTSAPARARAARTRCARARGRSRRRCRRRRRACRRACPRAPARRRCAVAVELERPAGELQAERRRLGVDAVRAAHLQRRAVLLGARDDGGEARASMPSRISAPASRICSASAVSTTSEEVSP